MGLLVAVEKGNIFSYNSTCVYNNLFSSSVHPTTNDHIESHYNSTSSPVPIAPLGLLAVLLRVSSLPHLLLVETLLPPVLLLLQLVAQRPLPVVAAHLHQPLPLVALLPLLAVPPLQLVEVALLLPLPLLAQLGQALVPLLLPQQEELLPLAVQWL